jgi:hypothetical protein
MFLSWDCLYYYGIIPAAQELYVSGLDIQEAGKDFAGAADFHFGIPVFLGLALTDRAVYKPAELAGTKFPGRATVSPGRGAFFHRPAGFGSFVVILQPPP